MHRTDSSFRRHPGGGSLRRFSFRRKPTRESIPEPVSTWSFNDETHEWQLLRGNIRFILFLFNQQRNIYAFIIIYCFTFFRFITHTRFLSILLYSC